MNVHPISAVLADVDGTLVTKDKVLTERAIAGRRAGCASAASSSPSAAAVHRAALQMLVEPLGLTMPMAAFNGGVIVLPDLSVLDERALPDYVVPAIVEAIEAHGLDVWIYTATDWYVRSRQAWRVDREASTSQSEPTVVATFDGVLSGVVKIVGVSNDHDKVAACEAALQKTFGTQVSAARSQPYYLDVTHPTANKGTRHRAAGAIPEDPAGGDRDDRRPAHRRDDVRAERPEHRHGQCQRRRAAAGHARDHVA